MAANVSNWNTHRRPSSAQVARQRDAHHGWLMVQHAGLHLGLNQRNDRAARDVDLRSDQPALTFKPYLIAGNQQLPHCPTLEVADLLHS